MSIVSASSELHFSFIKILISRRKMRFCLGFFSVVVFSISIWIYWLPAPAYSNHFCVCVARWCVTVLLFLLSCYAGVNLIYVPHAIRCYTTGVFCYFFLFCLFFGRDCYRSNKWWLYIPLLDSQSIGTSDRPSRISFSITKSFIHSSSSSRWNK